MNQIKDGIVGGYQYGPDFNQRMAGSLTLSDMVNKQKQEQQAQIIAQQQAQEKAQAQQAISQGARNNASPMDLISQGIKPEYLTQYSELFNKNSDWVQKNKDALKKQAEDNLRAMASDAASLDIDNDPEAIQKWMEQQHLRGISTDAYQVTPEFLKNLASFALTPQERFTNKIKQQEADAGTLGAKTNAKNAETQAANLEFQKKKFEVEQNKPKEIKPIPVGSSDAITGTGFALGKLKTLYDKVNSGDADVFKTTLTGAFVDPELNDAIKQLTEFHGRKQSGAAISNKEWNNFKSQILNPKYLLTIKGRKAAVKNLEDYIGKYYSQGEKVSGDKDWYDTYLQSAKEGVDKITKKDDFDSFWNEVNQ